MAMFPSPRGFNRMAMVDPYAGQAPKVRMVERDLDEPIRPYRSPNKLSIFGAMMKDMSTGMRGAGANYVGDLQDDFANQNAGIERDNQITNFGNALPSAQRPLFRMAPSEFVKAQVAAMMPKEEKLDFGWQRGPDGRLVPIPGGPADPAYKQAVNPKAFVINTGGSGMGTIPAGHRMRPDGTMEPIPGSPAAQKMQASKTKAENMMRGVRDAGDAVLTSIGKAKSLAQQFGTTGFVGDTMKGFGGTAAKDLQTQISTIVANIGFDRLTAMRQASPTGGALGAVSDRELGLLQSVIASLEQSQSQGQLLENLDRVEKQYKNTLMAMERAYAEDYGDAGGNGAGEPSLDDLLQKYGG